MQLSQAKYKSFKQNLLLVAKGVYDMMLTVLLKNDRVSLCASFDII